MSHKATSLLVLELCPNTVALLTHVFTDVTHHEDFQDEYLDQEKKVLSSLRDTFIKASLHQQLEIPEEFKGTVNIFK